MSPKNEGQVAPDLEPGDVEYFVSPAKEPVRKAVDPATLASFELQSQERVFFVLMEPGVSPD